MQTLYVLGSPIKHSRSPIFQNAALNAEGRAAHYEAREVDEAGMRTVAEEVRRGVTLGANITLPHKALAASLADVRSDEVEATGVANTWWAVDGQLYADNTDIHGLRVSLGTLFAERWPRKVAVLGAGGASRALLYSLAAVPELEVCIFNRSLERAAALCDEARQWQGAGFAGLHCAEWPDAQAPVRLDDDVDLIVQTTSLPVLKPSDEAPFAGFALPASGPALLELAYADEPTVMMRRAAEVGGQTLDGATMLLHQGARSYERWFGAPAPTDAMRAALADALGRPVDAIAPALSGAAAARWLS